MAAQGIFQAGLARDAPKSGLNLLLEVFDGKEKKKARGSGVSARPGANSRASQRQNIPSWMRPRDRNGRRSCQ